MLFSCVKEIRPAIPEYHGSIDQFLAGTNSKYNALKAYMSLDIKKKSGAVLSGSALADLDQENTQVRFYQLGIEIGDLHKLLAKKKEQYYIYEQAIRNGLVWWDLSEYKVSGNSKGITVSSGGRQVVFQPGTLVPLRQSLRLPRGLLTITYSDYRQTGDLWYPFAVHVEYGGNSMDMKMKKVEVSFRSGQDQ